MIQIIAEIGINHDGCLDKALELIKKAAWAEANVVKFQVRTPELCVPKDQWEVPKLTPWGETLPYLEYRKRMEFSERDLEHINAECAALGVSWSVSVWDTEALKRLTEFRFPWLKIPSAKITDERLIKRSRQEAKLILSTGMSRWDEVLQAVGWASPYIECVMHCHSAYPAPEPELNLKMIERLKWLGYGAGYSGHEYGLDPSIAAVHYGITHLERHITLDKHSRGSDHAASLEPDTFYKLVKKVRSAEKQIGDGRKRVWQSEEPARAKLRGSD